MKKNHILFVCAAAALAFASCQKEGPASEATATPSTGLEVITATTLSSKTTTVDGVNVLWENGDEIGLFVGGSANRQNSAIYTTSLDTPGATATFEHSNDYDPGQSASGLYFAVYPAKAVTKWASGMDTPTNSRAYVNLPQSQTAVVGSWDKSCGILASFSSTSTFAFKHMMSYVKFTVDASTTPFKSLTIKAKNNENLTGETIGLLYGESVAYDPYYPSTTYHSTVKLSNPNDAVFTEGTYYLTVLPGTFAQGFTFTFENAEGLTYEIVLDKEVVLGAGQVANMGTIGELVFEEETDEPSDEPVGASVPYVYAENDNNVGVVFWVDPNDATKGKIISGAATYVKWGPAKDLSEDMDNYITGDHTMAEIAEFVKLASDYSQANYPAVYFCDNLGEGWRLPSRDELNDMLKVYWGVESLVANTSYNTDDNSEAMNKFDSALAQCVTDDPNTDYDETKIHFGTPTATVNYWSGHANPTSLPSSRIYRVNMAPKYIFESFANPTNVQYVRCVREVELK